MASPDGFQPGQTQPPKATRHLGVRCWVLMILDGYGGQPTPIWVPCQMPITGPLRTLS
jgi:hypothetical protein